MESQEDLEVISYAGTYSSRLRQYDDLLESGAASHDLDINLDIREEFKDCNGVALDKISQENNMSKLCLKETKEQWDPLKEREPSLQDEREWRAIQLRGYMDPKKFYKGSHAGSLEPLPKRYHVGLMVGSSGISVGSGEESQAAGTINSRKRRKGTSLLKETMSSDHKWTKKKYREIQAEKTSGSKGWYMRERAKLKKSSK